MIMTMTIDTRPTTPSALDAAHELPSLHCDLCPEYPGPTPPRPSGRRRRHEGYTALPTPSPIHSHLSHGPNGPNGPNGPHGPNDPHGSHDSHAPNGTHSPVTSCSGAGSLHYSVGTGAPPLPAPPTTTCRSLMASPKAPFTLRVQAVEGMGVVFFGTFSKAQAAMAMLRVRRVVL